MTDTAVNGQDGGGWWSGATPPEPPPPPRPPEPARPSAGLVSEQRRPRPVDMPTGPPLQPQRPPMPDREDTGPSRRERREAQPAAQTIKERWVGQSRRYRWPMVAVGSIFVLLMGQRGCDRMGNQFGAAASASMAEQVAEMRAVVEQPASSQTVTEMVVVPLHWLKCPLTELAKTAIGYDASTGGKTLDPARASKVDELMQVALAEGTKLTDMRIVSVSPTQLAIAAVPVKDSTPLVDCSGGSVPPIQAPAVAPADATTATVPR